MASLLRFQKWMWEKKKKTGVGGLLMLFAEPKLHEWFDKIKRTMPTVCMTTDNPHGQQVPGLTWQVTAPCISCHHRGTESSWVQWSLHRPHQHTNSPTQSPLHPHASSAEWWSRQSYIFTAVATIHSVRPRRHHWLTDWLSTHGLTVQQAHCISHHVEELRQGAHALTSLSITNHATGM